ncbi:DUF2267 domain-containing protein [Halogeometricum sp. CBA1124]|uniref:DUF2267 domain-containing protein n=1 Tax=Halogeometricum sp. CBA1124 TaxID=2668071 RepID=UPI00142D0CA9|nr:DUF2267 domain-containing protein [Halogeometricum sp. CBA1124]MUV58632.1 DUF2267 domain-containing protein [Halogeometricum sp. CBA1124]
MNEHQFVSHVRERAGLESTDEARATVQATLRVFGSRLTEPVVDDLAAQVPESFGSDLTGESGTEPESFDAEAFVDRVRDREATDGRIDESDAASHAKAVASTLADSVGDGELGGIRAQLPGSYERLFNPDTAGS